MNRDGIHNKNSPLFIYQLDQAKNKFAVLILSASLVTLARSQRRASLMLPDHRRTASHVQSLLITSKFQYTKEYGIAPGRQSCTAMRRAFIGFSVAVSLFYTLASGFNLGLSFNKFFAVHTLISDVLIGRGPTR